MTAGTDFAQAPVVMNRGKAARVSIEPPRRQAPERSLICSFVPTRFFLIQLKQFPERGGDSSSHAARMTGLSNHESHRLYRNRRQHKDPASRRRPLRPGPFAKHSGEKRGAGFVNGGRNQLRRALYITTLSAICQKSSPLLRFRLRQRANGKPGKAVPIACARKLLTRFAPTKTRLPQTGL